MISLTPSKKILSRSYGVLTDSTIQLSGVFKFRVNSGDWGISKNLAIGPGAKLFSAVKEISGSKT